jgi:hypothetical protein
LDTEKQVELEDVIDVLLATCSDTANDWEENGGRVI